MVFVPNIKGIWANLSNRHWAAERTQTTIEQPMWLWPLTCQSDSYPTKYELQMPHYPLSACTKRHPIRPKFNSLNCLNVWYAGKIAALCNVPMSRGNFGIIYVCASVRTCVCASVRVYVYNIHLTWVKERTQKTKSHLIKYLFNFFHAIELILSTNTCFH